MKKIITIIAAALCLASCSNKTEGPAAGKCIGEIYVTSQSGAKSVLVDLPGMWRVVPQQSWISTDVNGRSGNGAFTLYYGSNESDFVSANVTRRGAVAIQNLTTMVSDTLYIRQQGIPDGKEYSSTPQNSYIEFLDTKLTKMKVTYANFHGVLNQETISNWLLASDSDLIAFAADAAMIAGLGLEGLYSNGTVAILNKSSFELEHDYVGSNPDSYGACLDGKVYQIADFDRNETAYLQLVSLLNIGYNKPRSESGWLIGGSLYYLSAMEVGYPNTPSWYPSNPAAEVFEADRYAQSNNLTDCIWMSHRQFNPTFKFESKEWRADYVYASNSLWNATIDVRLADAPLAGMEHKIIEITIKY